MSHEDGAAYIQPNTPVGLQSARNQSQIALALNFSAHLLFVHVSALATDLDCMHGPCDTYTNCSTCLVQHAAVVS